MTVWNIISGKSMTNAPRLINAPFDNLTVFKNHKTQYFQCYQSNCTGNTTIVTQPCVLNRSMSHRLFFDGLLRNCCCYTQSLVWRWNIHLASPTMFEFISQISYGWFAFPRWLIKLGLLSATIASLFWPTCWKILVR